MSGKRGNGEGSIGFDPKRERYFAALSYRDQDGRSKRKWFYGPTRLDVATKLVAATRERDKGVTPSVDKRSLSVFLDEWLEASIKPAQSRNTHRLYSILVHNHINPTIGALNVTKIGPQRHTAVAGCHDGEGAVGFDHQDDAELPVLGTGSGHEMGNNRS